MSIRATVLLILGAVTLARLALIGHVELAPDEAYYRMWAERLDWAYFSKGPGVAAAIWLGTKIAGTTEFGVRLLSPLLAFGTTWLLFLLAGRIYGEKVGFWAVIASLCIPIVHAGGLLMTIDPLSIFFWTASLYFLWRALENAPRFSVWWPLAGLAIGLGFLSKYTNAAAWVSAVLALAFTAKWRAEFCRAGFWAMTGAFILCAIPPVIWNARHDWITLGHLGARGGLDRDLGMHPTEFLEFFGAHFGVYSPGIFACLIAGTIWGVTRARRHDGARYLLAFGLPLPLLYGALAFRQAGEANWTAPAMVSLLVLACASFLDRIRARPWLRPAAIASLALGAAMSLVTLNSDALRALGVPWPYDKDPSARLRGWRTIADRAAAARAEFESMTGTPAFLIGSTYGLCAALDFYLPERRIEFPGHPPAYIPESQGIENQFSFWGRYDEFVDSADAPPGERDEYYTEEAGVNLFAGRNALYFTDRPEDKPPSSLKGGFEETELVALFRIERRDLPLREIRVYACYRYRGLPL